MNTGKQPNQTNMLRQRILNKITYHHIKSEIKIYQLNLKSQFFHLYEERTL